MKTIKSLITRTGYLLLAVIGAALAGCTTYVEQPRAEAPPPAYLPPPPPPTVVEVDIRTESDFYEPLRPYGRWEVVGPYGRCWVPARVDPDWRPYCNGHWERTEHGWYWVSDEPWGWATYHYGRWDFSPRIGWYWVPQTQWAPAWVSWHRGAGYVGWAPLQPSARFDPRGSITVGDRVTPPRAYVFVEERHFLEPVRPRTVMVNNTTIINKTVNITNVKVVNNTVINEGPRTDVIEKVSGHPVRPVPVRELRHKTEADVVAKEKIDRPTRDNSPHTAPIADRNPVPVRDQNAERDAQRRMESEKQKEADALKAAQDKKAQVEADRRAQEIKKAQMEADRRAQEAERKTQLEADRRARELDKQKQADALKAAQEKEAQLQAEHRVQEAQKKSQLEADRRAKESDRKAQMEAQRSERQKQVQSEQDRREQETKLRAQRAAEMRTNHDQTLNEKAAKKPATKAKRKTEEESQPPKPATEQPAQPSQQSP